MKEENPETTQIFKENSTLTHSHTHTQHKQTTTKTTTNRFY